MSSQPAPITEANTPARTETRQGDAVVIVLQNNPEKALKIGKINTIAEELLGYAPGELDGRRLETILGARTAEMLAEEIEYQDDAPDLGDVLSKYRQIRLRHRAGNEIAVGCGISRQLVQGQEACFQLLIPNERDTLARQQIRDFVALNLDGRKELDPVLGIPNRATAEGFLPLLRNYLAETGMEASFAVIRMDRFDKSMARYGHTGCQQLLQHMSSSCRTTFRNEDIVFALNEKMLGIVLFDISRESARLVFNRLRWKIRNHLIEFGGKPNFSVTGTLVFDMIDADRGETILTRTEDAAKAVDAEERNGLIELGN